jgi:hypothetical protein
VALYHLVLELEVDFPAVVHVADLRLVSPSSNLSDVRILLLHPIILPTTSSAPLWFKKVHRMGVKLRDSLTRLRGNILITQMENVSEMPLFSVNY